MRALGKIWCANTVWSAVAIMFAIALQIQISLLATDTYVGLRINLADLFLPFIGIGILTSIITKRTRLPVWGIKYGYVWIAALCGCFVYAFVNGYLRSGEINQWALVNKLAGWFILMGYLAIGAWMRSNDLRQPIRCFLIAFIGFFVVTYFIELPNILYRHLNAILIPAVFAYPADGFMANKNTYGFLFLCICTLTFCIQPCVKIKYLRWISIALIALSPLFIFYNGSRAIALIFPLIFIALAVRYFNWKQFIIAPLLCLGFVFWLISLNINNNAPYTHTFINLKTTAHESIQAVQTTQTDTPHKQLSASYDGDNLRMRITRLGVGVWLKNPIAGSGLGSIQDEQIEQYGKILTAMDNTALWILAEFGTPIFLLFISFFAYALFALNRAARYDDTLYGALARYAFYMLLIYAAISMLHEITYTRFFWVFFGLGLATTLRPTKNQA